VRLDWIGLVLALASGQFIDPRGPWGVPDYVFVISSIVYTSYIWLVGRAGPVFTIQVAYLVTLFGMIWAVVLLRETYTPLIWLALISMLFGIFLVQPRPSSGVTPDLKSRDSQKQ
jgi:drug/metabolite transporter (DMT)-like permease